MKHLDNGLHIVTVVDVESDPRDCTIIVAVVDSRRFPRIDLVEFVVLEGGLPINTPVDRDAVMEAVREQVEKEIRIV